MVAALYVDPDGPYAGLPDVELWPADRDARRYCGPWAVVAHPPCARWSRMAATVEAVYGYRRGDDGGCFRSALASVREWGGVLEHPSGTAAWRAHGLMRPPLEGWAPADWEGGWTCRVSQFRYGHVAVKETWLYAVRCELPSLDWRPVRKVGVTLGRPPSAQRRREREPRNVAFLHSGDKRRIHTPEAFRDVLLAMARSAGGTR